MPAEPSAPATPRSTYRLQLHDGFTFADAATIARYLADLGISHAYLSPILQAGPGSVHGYDVVDHGRVSEALGGDEGYAALSEALGRAGLGQVLDIVPNHMAIGPQNPWWWDVLENGPASRYAGHFDVDWEHPEPHLRNLVLLPVLPDHYGRVVESGGLRLDWDGRRFTIGLGTEDRFPVAPRSLDGVLAAAAARAGSDELAFLADAFEALPPSNVKDRPSLERRHRDKEVLASRVAALAAEQPAVAAAIAAAVDEVNAHADALDDLLARQNYRLAWWRAASRDLGYRRFFDVTTLAGLRVEDQEVFLDTHRRLLEWLEAGVIDGLRVDHPDGLRDPVGYLARLRVAAPRGWIVVEKILMADEALRPDWPIDGTTGYEFLIRAQRVLLDPAGEVPLTELARRVAGQADGFEAIAREARLEIVRDLLGSELGRLTSVLVDVIEGLRRHRDHTRHDLHEALAEILAAMPVYRTYVQAPVAGPSEPDPADADAIETAVEAARTARPDLPADLFDVLGDLLLGRVAGELAAEFVARFQQLSGPVMAKGVEDTAFYRDVRLQALGDVGGDPGAWALPVGAFHAAAAETQARWPATMLTTSSHDTKRSEDVRARLLVLAEVPGRWAATVEGWIARNAAHRTADGPDPAIELALYQTLVGAWPIDVERTTGWLLKAMRETRVHTSWTEPDEGYESAVLGFAAAILADAAFVAEVEAFVGSILVVGRTNSLAQALLKLAAPGVPDVYQGNELWDLSLVDPDNRRPVDFELRRRLLAELATAGVDEVAASLADPADPGRPKLWLTARALRLRASRPEAFGARGAYEPIESEGAAAGHVVAFTRGGSIAAVVPRLQVGLGGDWRDTAILLPVGRWTNHLADEIHEVGTDGRLALGRLLPRFPVALLEREAGG